MIVTKTANNVSGFIGYRYDSDSPDITEADRESMHEGENFRSLSELIELMKPEALERVKVENDASRVWIYAITLHGKSEDGLTTTSISLYENRTTGHVATTLNNDDINNRLLLNMLEIKKLVDNTLDEYPVRYGGSRNEG